MNCYFDGSIGGDSDQWLTLGGLIATNPNWATFQKQWEAMLRDRYPIAPYVHMTDLITGNDPFEICNGWTEYKVDRLVQDAEIVLGQMHKEHVRAFACSIDLSARKRLIAQGYEISDPAAICAEIGMGALIQWYRDTHPFEMAYLFYDQDEQFISSIRSSWLIYDKQRKQRLAHPFWGTIANVRPVSMHDTPGIQAADIVAWSVTRRLRYGGTDDKWAPLANSLIGAPPDLPYVILPSEQLVIDESLMRSKYHKKTTPT